MPDGTIGYIDPHTGQMVMQESPVTSSPVNSAEHFGSNGYQFGDLMSGNGAARVQANAQWELQQNQQAYNSAEAEKDRQWQQAMRDSSISSAFEQYKDVGVNPYLAVMQGSQGVTSAGGSTATSGQGSVSKATQNLTGMMASAAGIGLALAKIIKALK